MFVDARYEKVRVDRRVVNRGVLVVSGVRDDGLREVLGVGVADTESEATYQELFRSLKRRGLSGVQLVVSDDHEGLKSAIARHFQGASHQRCQVHYARNLLGMVSFARRKELASDLRAIFAAPDRNQALTIAASVAEKWRQKGNEKVAEHLEEHIEECLSCLAFPESHRRRIRTRRDYLGARISAQGNTAYLPPPPHRHRRLHSSDTSQGPADSPSSPRTMP